MKFNKIIALPVLTLAAVWGLTACTDEVDYHPAEELQTPQVYFPNTNPSTVDLDDNQSEVTIDLERVNTQGSLTVPVTATATVNGEAVSIFTVPASATFADGSKTAPVKISFDFANIEQEVSYDIVLKVSGNDLTPYGKSEQTVTLLYAPWSAWQSVSGKGVYYLNAAYVGGLEIDLAMRTSLLNPDNVQYRFTASQIFSEEITFSINKATNTVTVPYQPTGDAYNNNPIYLCDFYTYYTEVVPNAEGAEMYKNSSKFDPKTGVITFPARWYVPALKGGWSGNESIQLPGFPDYSMEVSTNGTYISEGDFQEYAVVNVQMGPDVASYAIRFCQGRLNDAQINSVADEMKANAEETLYPTSRTFEFPVNEEDYYTVVMVPYDAESNPQATTSYTFFYELQGIDWNEGWKTVAKDAVFNDAFAVLIGYSSPVELEVAVQESEVTPGLYRIDNPYADDPYEYGVERGHYYILIDATNPDAVSVKPSYNGMFNVASIATGKLVGGTKFVFPASSLAVLTGINTDGSYVWTPTWDEEVTLLDLEPEAEAAAKASVRSVKVAAKAKSLNVVRGAAPREKVRKFEIFN